MQKAKTIALWVLQVLLCLLFTLIGYEKFVNPIWARRFQAWGYPDHFYQLIGALEVLGALSLLVPRLAGYGAAGLMVIMVGAGATHLVHGEKQWVSPAVFLVLLSIIAVVRLRARAASRDQLTAAVNHNTSTA